jgi:hypothetical protein
MGLISGAILGASSANDELKTDSRFRLKQQTQNRKSYLFKKGDIKATSEDRRDAIKSSLFQVLDQDDTSVTCDFASDDETSKSLRGSDHKRSKSTDGKEGKPKTQSKLRGKKSELLSGGKKSIPGPPQTDRTPRMRSMRKSPQVSMGKTPPTTRPTTLPNRARRERSVSDVSSMSLPNRARRERSNSDVSAMCASASNPAPQPLRRKSSMGSFFGAFSKQGDENDESKKQEDNSSRAPRQITKRSMSMGAERRRPRNVETNTAPVQTSQGQGLGAFFSQQSTSGKGDDDDDDDDDSSDGADSTTSGTSWITWAASSALKPLEKLYDDLNGVGVDDKKKKVPKRSGSSSDDSDISDDEEEFPNTQAEEFASTKLTVTEKVAGLRFVASKQRRRSLYM